MKASCTVSVKNPNGIEVRDADKLVAVARGFKSDVRFGVRKDFVSAKSLFSVITLDWRSGSVVDIVADGADANSAVKTLANLIDSI